MNLLIGIILGTVCIYTAVLAMYVYHWSRVQVGKQPSGRQPFISVIVAARNEEAHIDSCLQSILGQNYNKAMFEVILVDDHSTDKTAEIAGKIRDDRLRLVRAQGKGKKAALSTGVSVAQGQIIATTDADCRVPEEWLTSVTQAFTEDIGAVTGPVCYPAGDRLLHTFQAFEIFGLMVITGAGIRSGWHYLANGANLAFKKTAFDEVGGYAGNEQYASGDDLFLVEKIANMHPGGFAFLKDPGAIVKTFPQKTVGKLVDQRLRWASKNHALADKTILRIWGFVWVVNVLVLAGIISIPWMSPGQVIIMTGALLIKMTGEWLLIRGGAVFCGERLNMPRLVPSMLLNIPYVVVTGVLTLLSKKYTWKGRVTR